MRGQTILYVDQYRNTPIAARTVKELQFIAGGGRVSKMYQDGIDGKTYHTGYVVGRRWFTAFIPFRKEM